MQPRIGMGMLCFNRPVHTALTIAFALHNKSEHTDFTAFYGIHADQKPPSKALDNMLRDLHKECGLDYVYMGPDKPNNVQGNVDTLMFTLSSKPDLSCFCKIDDDVIIGRGSDVIMANLLWSLEPQNCYLLMGQAVPEHMRRSHPFCWEAMVNGTRVVQRAQKACPMETYTFVSPKCLPFLKQRGMSMSCENSRGTYGPYTRKITNAGGKVCLALTPAINMQHIGLTTTIEVAQSARSWAPARSWEPMDKVIEVDRFDFAAWESSHKTNTQKDFAIETIKSLRPTMLSEYTGHLDIMLKHLEAYDPAADRATPVVQAVNKLAVKPPEPVTRPTINKRSPGLVLRKLPDGRVVRAPGPVHRVVIRTIA